MILHLSASCFLQEKINSIEFEKSVLISINSETKLHKIKDADELRPTHK